MRISEWKPDAVFSVGKSDPADQVCSQCKAISGRDNDACWACGAALGANDDDDDAEAEIEKRALALRQQKGEPEATPDEKGEVCRRDPDLYNKYRLQIGTRTGDSRSIATYSTKSARGEAEVRKAFEHIQREAEHIAKSVGPEAARLYMDALFKENPDAWRLYQRMTAVQV